MIYLWEGTHHKVYITSYQSKKVLKFPTKNNFLSKEQAEKSLQFFKENFSSYLPETHIYKHPEYSYYIEQENLSEWETIENILQKQKCLSKNIHNSLLQFFQKIKEVHDKTDIIFDITWTPRNENNKFSILWCSNIIILDDKIYFIDNIASHPSIQENKWKRLYQSHFHKKRREQIIKFQEQINRNIQIILNTNKNL